VETARSLVQALEPSRSALDLAATAIALPAAAYTAALQLPLLDGATRREISARLSAQTKLLFCESGVPAAAVRIQCTVTADGRHEPVASAKRAAAAAGAGDLVITVELAPDESNSAVLMTAAVSSAGVASPTLSAVALKELRASGCLAAAVACVAMHDSV
jgi:hypothetical protein